MSCRPHNCHEDLGRVFVRVVVATTLLANIVSKRLGKISEPIRLRSGQPILTGQLLTNPPYLALIPHQP